jgi:hypothetical protein
MPNDGFLERVAALLNDPATDAMVRANRMDGHDAMAVLRRDEALLVVARLGMARIRATTNRFVVLDRSGQRIGGVHCGIADLARALTTWGWGDASVEGASAETKASAARLKRAIADVAKSR